MIPDSNTWKPAVQFHFKVIFQWDGSEASASFAEVDGLGQSLTLSSQTGVNRDGQMSVVGVSVEDLVLKRAIEPIDDKISKWLKECFSFLDGGWIRICNISISLLGEDESEELARWKCLRAVPLKWKINPLNASESKIAIETLTLKYKELIREK